MGKRLLLGFGVLILVGYSLLAATLIFLSLPFTGWRALSVQTGSMVPAIHPGALVVVQRMPSSALRVGDIITYTTRTAPHATITHRIVGFTYRGAVRDVIVKGDANPQPDQPVQAWQIVGRIRFGIPFAGKIIDFLHRPAGLLMLVYLPALAAIVYELQLLIRRLTALEVRKFTARPMSASIQPVGQAFHHPSRPLYRTRRRFDVVRKLDITLSVLLVAGMAGWSGQRTFSALTAHAQLPSNYISAQAVSESASTQHALSATRTRTVSSAVVSGNSVQSR